MVEFHITQYTKSSIPAIHIKPLKLKEITQQKFHKERHLGLVEFDST